MNHPSLPQPRPEGGPEAFSHSQKRISGPASCKGGVQTFRKCPLSAVRLLYYCISTHGFTIQDTRSIQGFKEFDPTARRVFATPTSDCGSSQCQGKFQPKYHHSRHMGETRKRSRMRSRRCRNLVSHLMGLPNESASLRVFG